MRLSQVAKLPVVHIEANGGQWVRPAEALFLDASFRAQPELLEALLREGVPLADQAMPAELVQACLQHIPGARELSPQAVRAQLGTRQLMATSLSASERTQVLPCSCLHEADLPTFKAVPQRPRRACPSNAMHSLSCLAGSLVLVMEAIDSST